MRAGAAPSARSCSGKAARRSSEPSSASCSQTDVLTVARMSRRARRDPLRDVGDAVRLRELARELEERLRALRLAALRLVEPRVLEGDRRVAGQHLEQPQVVGVELVEAELRDDDHAGHARAVLERDGEERLLDLGRADDLLAESRSARRRR